ncbi:S8 family serine peptidase [bacterium]|nr:S8 family serine peptidase [bacterium]
MADVFLSYRNTDERRKLIARFATILRTHGVSVWWDYGLDAGESYREQIMREMGQAKLVIPFWCEESITSEWVRMEAEMGKDKLLPARLQRVTPPAQFEAIHAAHLETWNGSILDPVFDEFLMDILRRLGRSADLPADTRAELASLPALTPLGPPKGSGAGSGAGTRRSPGARSGGKRGVALLAAGALALVAAAGAAGAWIVFGGGSATPVLAVDNGGGPAATDVPEAELAEAPGWVEPNDPLLPQQWYLGSADGGGAGILDYRRRTGATGEGVVIASIDTGVYLGHAELMRSASILPGADFVSDPMMANDGDGRDDDPSDPGDGCGPAGGDQGADTLHGTLNASLIIANTNNGVGIAGVAPGAKFVPVRAVGKCGGRLSDINDAIRWAAGLLPLVGESGVERFNDHPAEIILIPLSLFQTCPSSLQEAVTAVTERGAMVVVPAGNQRVDVSLASPGGCKGVISVAAITRSGRMPDYSNWGADLLAPGGNLKEDVDGDGRPDGIVGAKYSSGCLGADGAQADACEYSFEQGTSMAASIAAGALALLKSRHMGESAADLRTRLLAATRPMGAVTCSAS